MVGVGEMEPTAYWICLSRIDMYMTEIFSQKFLCKGKIQEESVIECDTVCLLI